MKKFDLNIEKVLEDWETFHALREIIANALDETFLSGSADIEIWNDQQKRWHIRDFGRGLQYHHLTQKENEEKLNSAVLIGKFGVGLKDALATFDRRGVSVLIRSKFGDITLTRSEKHGFADIVTLHAVVNPPQDPNFVGTEFILDGCTEEDVSKAKSMFLKFSGDEVLESTPLGQVLQPATETPVIYISGVKVAEEENFLFSYNITSLNAAIKKALNRERTNVGRTAYSDRVKAILLSCKSEQVAMSLIEDVGNFQKGLLKDELKWTDVYVHACKLMNALRKVIFLTPNERSYAAGLLSYARSDGYKIITIPDNVRAKLKGETDYEGNPLRDLNEFIKQWNESFEFSFVKVNELNPKEREIFNRTKEIFEVIGGRPEEVKSVKISTTMRMGKPGYAEVVGVWEPDIGRIVIKRTQLQSLAEFAGTLLHETVHAVTGAPDVSELFEQGLTEFLGVTAAQMLPPPKKNQKETTSKRSDSKTRSSANRRSESSTTAAKSNGGAAKSKRGDAKAKSTSAASKRAAKTKSTSADSKRSSKTKSTAADSKRGSKAKSTAADSKRGSNAKSTAADSKRGSKTKSTAAKSQRSALKGSSAKSKKVSKPGRTKEAVNQSTSSKTRSITSSKAKRRDTKRAR